MKTYYLIVWFLLKVEGRTDLTNSRQALRAFLLNPNYDKYAHPRWNSSFPVVVGVGMGLIHLNINELASTLEVNAWMRLSWFDDHLVWDPNNYTKIKLIHFSDEEIWKPDILLYNNADDSQIHPYGKTHLLVKSTGEVLWVPPINIKAFCKLDLKYWPMDSHICKLKFGSWTSNGDQIDLVLYKNATTVEKYNFYTNTLQWDLVSSLVEKDITKYSDYPETYPHVTFTFYVQRNSPGHRAIIILPCLVIMLMTLCSFILPCSSVEKVLLNGIALIISIMFLLYFSTILPYQSTRVPVIVMFYSNTVALIGIAILINTICVSMATVRKYTSPPKFFIILFSGAFGKLLCLEHYYHRLSSTHRIFHELTEMAESDQIHSSSLESYSQSSIMKEWVLVAAGLERIFLVIYSIAFSIVTSIYI